MSKYKEHEVKVLDVNVEEVQLRLEALGAKKVFDDNRMFTTFDTIDSSYSSSNKIIRLTEEGKLKLSISSFDNEGNKETIKVFTSRKQETVDLLSKLGIYPIAEVRSYRISYELGGVDFDIDQFPGIPPFMEIDDENLDIALNEILQKLGLTSHKIVTLGTEEIFGEYGHDYYELFKI